MIWPDKFIFSVQLQFGGLPIQDAKMAANIHLKMTIFSASNLNSILFADCTCLVKMIIRLNGYIVFSYICACLDDNVRSLEW